MSDTPDRSNEQAIIHRLVQWGEQQRLVRAMLLTSSRTNPAAPVDALSDYDVVVVVTDIQPYLTDEIWLEDFGELLVVYRDPVRYTLGCATFTRVTHYQDGTKIDYSIMLWINASWRICRRGRVWIGRRRLLEIDRERNRIPASSRIAARALG
jgi:hypothetical protein